VLGHPSTLALRRAVRAWPPASWLQWAAPCVPFAS
jgi:hypothetical protein